MAEFADVEEYLQPTPDREVDRFFLSVIADWAIPRLPGQRLLELGAGDGIWTPKLVSAFSHVTTVDRSLVLLQALEAKLTRAANWTGVCATFEEYQPDSRFDTVVASYVFEHVESPWNLLLRIHQWLRPGGTLALIVPNGLSLHRRLAVIMGLQPSPTELGPTDKRLEHRHAFTPAEIDVLLADGGFRTKCRLGLIAKTLPNALLVHCSPEQLRGLVLLGLELPIDLAGALFYLAET